MGAVTILLPTVSEFHLLTTIQPPRGGLSLLWSLSTPASPPDRGWATHGAWGDQPGQPLDTHVSFLSSTDGNKLGLGVNIYR